MPTVRSSSHRRALALAVLAGLSLGASRADAAACPSTCAQQLVACKRTCAGGGQTRRDCRAACAERSTCTAPGASIRTLAYVVNECRTDALGSGSIRQKLMIRRGNCDPVVAMEAPPVEGPDPGLCRLYGETRNGAGAVVVGIFQHIGVLPDGSGVVFEVTDDVSLFPFATPKLPEEGKGIFFVGADGRGLHRLSPRTTGIPIIVLDPTAPGGFGANDVFFFAISPDSRTVAFSGLGLDSDGRESQQIFALEIASGKDRQLTSFPGGTVSTATTSFPYPSFADNQTVSFFTSDVRWMVKLDGSGLKQLPGVIAVPGAQVVPNFSVSGESGAVLHGLLPGEVEGPNPNGDPTSEVFLVDGRNVLQLTSFHRADTIGWSFFRGRVLVEASANPLGTNPGDLCQLFSVGRLGGRLRQLTHLPPDAGGRQPVGCNAPGIPGAECTISNQGVAQDAKTGAVLFQSSCDPLGTNPPFGVQLFVMRPDGSGLRQITQTRGMVLGPDGSVSVEAAGPIGYAAEHSG